MSEALCIHVIFGDRAGRLPLWVLWQVGDVIAHGCSQAGQAHQLEAATERLAPLMALVNNISRTSRPHAVRVSFFKFVPNELTC